MELSVVVVVQRHDRALILCTKFKVASSHCHRHYHRQSIIIIIVTFCIRLKAHTLIFGAAHYMAP